MLLYYITDRTQFPGNEPTRQHHLLARIAEAARCGVDYIQLREKDLSARALETLSRAALHQLRTANHERTTLLINSRTDIAIATGAGGVHLPSNDISPQEARAIWNANTRPTIAVSCHTQEEVARAALEQLRTGNWELTTLPDSRTANRATTAADFVVFGPVFEKNNSPQSAGLDALRQACRQPIPVLALGGVTVENARACLQAGASGIAGIRIFQQNDIATVVATLRSLANQQPA